MFGAILLAAWVDFLSLADVVLQRFHFYSVKALFADMNRVQRLMEPSLAALASQDPEQVEAAATAMPDLMGKLTQELSSIREGVRVATVRGGQVMTAAQIVELITMLSAMKISLARLPPPPAAPVALGPALVMGSGGVMLGSQVVVSAEWVEMVRRLVQAGVISLPTVSAAVRIYAGQVMMAQANGACRRACETRSEMGPRFAVCTRPVRPERGCPRLQSTTSFRKSIALGSSNATSRALWTSTSSASGWNRLTTKRFTAAATGAWVACGPMNGAG